MLYLITQRKVVIYRLREVDKVNGTYKIDVVGIASAIARADHLRQPIQALTRDRARTHSRESLFDCL